MKINRKVLLLLPLICMLQLETAKAQFITYDPAQFGNALVQIGKAAVHIKKVVETIKQIKTHIDVAKSTKDEIMRIWNLQEKVRQDLQKLKGLRNLRWNDLQNVFENAMLLVDNPENYFRYRLSHVSQLYQKLSSGKTSQDVRDLYEYFNRFNTAYDPALDYDEHLQNKQEQVEKKYAAELMIQKRRFHLAMSYSNMAEEMAEKAEELRMKVGQESNGLEMTHGERILAQKAASDAMLESIELQEKAAAMLELALKKGENQRGVDIQAIRAKSLKAQAASFQKILPDQYPE